MGDSEVSGRMRDDWNARAREDAGYYVAFGRREQTDADFYATATEVINGLESELRRVPATQRSAWKALEIGCGPGRLMRPMSRHFAEIHGVDVSDEMIALARERLRDIPNAHPHATDGASLSEFADESFDFVYSYAVFQHVPSREVIVSYMRETHRVLKPGGLARLQFNGMPAREASFDTWAGARIGSSEVLEFTQMHDLQLLALEGAGTQYMWTTWRKQAPGWQDGQAERQFPDTTSRVRRITNSHSSEPGAPSRGRYASISLWVENLPVDAGLHHIRVQVGDSLGTVTYIGPLMNDGLQQVSVMLPELEATGLLPIELRWLEQPLAPLATLRVIPPGPSVPCICSVTDGMNLVADKRIETRQVKMILEEVARPHEIEASVDGLPVGDLEFLCTDPRPQRFEVNFRLPDEIAPGQHQLEVRIGRRKLAPVTLEITS
ncbi:MAG: Methyltransferase type 11 [Bryobacterales bacterium]|nr:Methyltransferase type 11 [Bryobacterales bacterium]